MSHVEHLPSAVHPWAAECDRVSAATARAKQACKPTGELREAVYACVRGLRAAGTAPEQVVIRVKALTARGGVERLSACHAKPWPGADRFRDEIVDAVVRWSIEAYYDDSTRECR